MRIKYKISVISFCLLLLTACSISYKFNGASIDYTKVKSISIKDFPNQASFIPYPPLAQVFTEGLKDIYVRQPRLSLVKNNGDLELEGEIIGCELTPMAVKEDAYSSRTKLTMTVRVRYTNRSNPDEDFEQTFSAYREFDSNQMLQTVQEELFGEIVEEISDLVYNATVANW